VLLLESALRLLCWESTYWATQAALALWLKSDLSDSEEPVCPVVPFNPAGWKLRAAYIGGADKAIQAGLDETDTSGSTPTDFLRQMLHPATQEPMLQIRRLFEKERPLGDLWLTEKQEEKTSVSKNSTAIVDLETQKTQHIHMSRFQNLFQPVLMKGHPVLASPKPDYLRQRTLQQLKTFRHIGLEQYPQGWGEE
jgi:hypothetical protein